MAVRTIVIRAIRSTQWTNSPNGLIRFCTPGGILRNLLAQVRPLHLPLALPLLIAHLEGEGDAGEAAEEAIHLEEAGGARLIVTRRPPCLPRPTLSLVGIAIPRGMWRA